MKILPCVDSDELAASVRRRLDIPTSVAADLGRSAAEAAEKGYYIDESGRKVDWGSEVEAACTGKVSIPPDASLPVPEGSLPVPEGSAAAEPEDALEQTAGPRQHAQEMRVQVRNETTLVAAREFVEKGLTPAALNFANGVTPGGGFLRGARAQEEVLCRSSALYRTLVGDRMYEEHRKRERPDSSAWAIYSPGVPVFRTDDGTALDEPWLLTFITCAAPYAPGVGQPESGDLLVKRILRVLEIARAYGHTALVLGAWGCGAFHNDPDRTARDFRRALEDEFAGAFTDVVFAIADWSPDRRFVGPFCRVFQ